MNWKTLVGCVALSGSVVACGPAAMPCGNMVCDSGETSTSCMTDCPVSRTYVVSTIDTEAPPGDPSMSYGFNLDDSVGGIAGQACTAALDFTSRVTGEEGVDNQLGTVLPTLDMMIEGGVNGAIQEQIQSGSLLLMFEVSGINSFSADTSVTVRIVLGELMAGATIMTDGTGLAANQTFASMTEVATVTGTIAGGRLSAMTAALPLSFTVMDAPITLMLRNVVIGGRISDAGGFTNGEFGAVVLVDDVVELAMMFITGVDRATVEALAMPDIDPDATGESCNSISAGLGFESVEASIE